jgi:probable phosphoglycerate mutase
MWQSSTQECLDPMSAHDTKIRERTATIYLARHGETDWNAAGRWQGHTDVPLNANGRAQAMALGASLRGEGIVAIASSDLSRARETASIAGGVLGLAVTLVDRDLRERGFGRFEGLTRAECAERFPEEWARYHADPRTAPPGGEPQSSLLARAAAAVLRAAASLSSRIDAEGENAGVLPARRPALVVTHGGTMRALLGAIAGEPVAPIANGAIHAVHVVNGQLVGAAAWHRADR